jgi:hypothetical protein
MESSGQAHSIFKKKEIVMNQFTVTGGNKFQRKICNDVVVYLTKRLLPRYRTLSIAVKLKKFSAKGEEAIGYCLMEDDNRNFIIELEKTMKLKELILCLCHEFVHLKQYARGEMNFTAEKWKKSKVKIDTPYMDLPWEKEAYRREKILADECWDNGII